MALGLRAVSGAALCLALRGAGGLAASSSPHGCWVLRHWGQLPAFMMSWCHRDVLSTLRRKSKHGCKGCRGSGLMPSGLTGMC